ncbi:light-harvesting complex-like protein OHP1, chloroplastic [Prosopis cineraria]|uniref:light-harvesting complex-like protein OHP1, chloroplastic n=1 Tax=Prosopis cineraria TaxID=364024 RepID=UPI00240FDA8E|nr:light-harvesting complex-like protein OHP1, chloroplastic [Prosopis cineraria]
MAASSAIESSSLLPSGILPLNINTYQHQKLFFLPNSCLNRGGHLNKTRNSFRVEAVKSPPGVELPKVEPQFKAPFLGFTKTAEIWNSRACMIGIIGVFILELIINKGILQVIGVDVGKGLNLPL